MTSFQSGIHEATPPFREDVRRAIAPAASFILEFIDSGRPFTAPTADEPIFTDIIQYGALPLLAIADMAARRAEAVMGQLHELHLFTNLKHSMMPAGVGIICYRKMPTSASPLGTKRYFFHATVEASAATSEIELGATHYPRTRIPLTDPHLTDWIDEIAGFAEAVQKRKPSERI